jgi:hypothetical protein
MALPSLFWAWIGFMVVSTSFLGLHLCLLVAKDFFF